MILLRKIFFYLFAAVYVVLCPIVILYALGYIWTPKTEQGIVKTGLIYLKVFPRDATIQIGKKKIIQRTPVMLNDLLAGEYDLKISKQGFRSIEMQVRVEPGQATLLDKLLLIPEDLKPVKLLQDPLKKWMAVPGTPYFLLFTGTDLKEVAVYDWKNKEARKLLSLPHPFQDAKILDLKVSAGSSYIVILASLGKDEKLLGIHLAKKDSEIMDLSSILNPALLANTVWEADKSNYFFMNHKPRFFQSSGKTVSFSDLKTMSVQPQFLSAVQGFGLYEDYLYMLDSAAVFRIDYGRKNPPKEAVDKIESLRSLFLPDEFYRLEFLNDKIALFVSAHGQLLTNRLPYLLIEYGVRGYDFFEKKERLLFWTQNALGVLSFSEPGDRRHFFERGVKIDWIYSRGRSITQAFWTYDGSHVLFIDQGAVFLLDLSRAYSAEPERLLTVAPDSPIFYDEHSGVLYYLDPKDSLLTSAALLGEDHSLLTLTASKDLPDSVFVVSK